VLPPAFPHLSEEEILNPLRRKKKLYSGDPLRGHLTDTAADLLRQSIEDLENPAELQELGMALVLDRPLGVFKGPGEPDQTVLVSYEAFSRQVAQRNLEFIGQHIDGMRSRLEDLQKSLSNEVSPQGIALAPAASPVRPGVPSLQDALRIAPDFILLRTTRRAAADFIAQFDWTPLGNRIAIDFLSPNRPPLIVGGEAVKRPRGSLLIFDETLRPRLEFAIDPRGGYSLGGAAEYPSAGLQLIRIWDPGELDIQAENIWIRPRDGLTHASKPGRQF
jgi:hypothetical protein